jgi:cytoskeleton protein RodZ
LRYSKINAKRTQINVVIFDLYMVIEKKPSNNSQDLKAIREAQGLSLKDVFRNTRVSAVYLQAIENSDFYLLPAPIYTKNFIKTYARALGIDSKPILTIYEDYLNSLKVLQLLPPEDAPEGRHLSARIASYKTYWGIVSVLIIISVVVWLISKQYQPASDIIYSTGRIVAVTPENMEQTVNSPVNATDSINQQIKTSSPLALNEINKQSQTQAQSISAGEKNNAVKPLEEQSSSTVENVQPIANSEEAGVLVIKAIEETWIRIKADQNPSFQVLLKTGEKIERKAATFDMDIGNAGGIKIQFKGKNIENLGNSGQVIHLRLP